MRKPIFGCDIKQNKIVLYFLHKNRIFRWKKKINFKAILSFDYHEMSRGAEVSSATMTKNSILATTCRAFETVPLIRQYK